MFKALLISLIGVSQQGPLDIFTEYSYGGPKGDNLKITEDDIKAAGLTLPTFDNGRVETTLDNCKKVCAAQKGCLYFMWSDKKGSDSYTRCYTYDAFGTYKDNFKNPYIGGNGSDL